MGAIGYRKTSHAHTGVSERDAGYKGQHVQPGALLYLLLQRKKKKKKRRRRGTKVSRPDFCHEFCKMIFTEIGVKVCL